jgi:hypothetical protein
MPNGLAAARLSAKMGVMAMAMFRVFPVSFQRHDDANG